MTPYTLAWINDETVPDSRLAQLAHRHAAACVSGTVAGRHAAEELLSAARQAIKHVEGPHARHITDTLAAVHTALTTPDSTPAWPGAGGSDGRAATIDAARAGSLTAATALWASCGFDTSSWQEPADVPAAPLPPLDELDVDTLVGAGVVIRQAGTPPLEGTLLAADQNHYLIHTRIGEDLPEQTVSLIPRDTVLSIGVWTELLPWTYLDTLDAIEQPWTTW